MNQIKQQKLDSVQDAIVFIHEYEGFDQEDFEELEPEILTLDVGRKFEKTKNFQKYKEVVEKLFEERQEIAISNQTDLKQLSFGSDIKFELKQDQVLGTNIYFQRQIVQGANNGILDYVGSGHDRLVVELSQVEPQLEKYINSEAQPQKIEASGPANYNRINRLESILGNTNYNYTSDEEYSRPPPGKKKIQKSKGNLEESKNEKMPKLEFSSAEINEFLKKGTGKSSQNSRNRSHEKAQYLLKKISKTNGPKENSQEDQMNLENGHS